MSSENSIDFDAVEERRSFFKFRYNLLKEDVVKWKKTLETTFWHFVPILGTFVMLWRDLRVYLSIKWGKFRSIHLRIWLLYMVLPCFIPFAFMLMVPAVGLWFNRIVYRRAILALERIGIEVYGDIHPELVELPKI